MESYAISAGTIALSALFVLTIVLRAGDGWRALAAAALLLFGLVVGLSHDRGYFAFAGAGGVHLFVMAWERWAKQ